MAVHCLDKSLYFIPGLLCILKIAGCDSFDSNVSTREIRGEQGWTKFKVTLIYKVRPCLKKIKNKPTRTGNIVQLDECLSSPGFNPQEHISCIYEVRYCMPGILALGKWKEEDQKFRSLGYRRPCFNK